ncbi:unnamed protein product [Cylicostephanus goldi]|uniref:Uncharacterized protein n=1 Tax=Cylicostephanus goldi TaxID=71465 RepID=A0A3P6T6I7_CYLGO|nr:unnamed protein product [Cylicostephanus goldi]
MDKEDMARIHDPGTIPLLITRAEDMNKAELVWVHDLPKLPLTVMWDSHSLHMEIKVRLL